MRRHRAFTLIELLVVIAVIALLLGILFPALRKVRRHATLLVCASNLHNVGVAIHSYASQNDDTIPFGPDGRPVSPTNFYTAKGNVTSLLSLENDGSPVGLGLLLDSYLSDSPKVLFCPGADQPSKADEQLAIVGEDQAQCDYYYRHASMASLHEQTPEFLAGDFRVRLSRLGKNRNGGEISSLVMDVQFVIEAAFESLGIFSRTNHNRKGLNVLLADNRVIRQDNADDAFTVDVGWFPQSALDKILGVFERADELR